MTTGHHPKRIKVTKAQVEKALADPRVQRFIKMPRTLDHEHDVPYFGGISNDFKTIYIDRHVPLNLKVGDKTIDLELTIPVHEVIETALIECLGYRYEKAHAIATVVEDRRVEQLGVVPQSYADSLRPYIRSDEKEKLAKVPPALFTRPYSDSGDSETLRRIKKAQS